jgi:hypothetical protein
MLALNFSPWEAISALIHSIPALAVFLVSIVLLPDSLLSGRLRHQPDLSQARRIFIDQYGDHFRRQ